MKASAALREAFLRGEEVVAEYFGKAHGLQPRSVGRVLRSFGTLVEARLESKGMARFKVWRCVNIAGMCSWQPHRTGPGRPKKSPDTDPLMAAWGMRIVDIALPSTVHEMQGAWQ